MLNCPLPNKEAFTEDDLALQIEVTKAIRNATPKIRLTFARQLRDWVIGSTFTENDIETMAWAAVEAVRKHKSDNNG